MRGAAGAEPGRVMEWAAWPVVAAVFLAAGAVKGVLGFGLPMVSLGALTMGWDVAAAMSVLLAPALATNVWQAVGGGQGWALVRRLRWFLAAAAATVWSGTAALAYGTAAAVALGAVMMGVAVLDVCRVRVAVAPGREGVCGVAFGAVTGFLTGVTGSFTFPGVLFLQGIGLGREALVQAMGILFVLSTVVLGVALAGRGVLTAEAGALSGVATVFALLGMGGGRRVRRRLSEVRFRQVFCGGLFLLGGGIVLGRVVGF